MASLKQFWYNGDIAHERGSEEMNKRRRILSLMVVALLLSLTVLGCGKKADVVAVVNGEEIERVKLDQRMTKMKEVYKQQGADFESEQGKAMLDALERQVLDGMIEEIVLLQEADKKGVLPTDEDVKAKIEETKKKFGTEEEFNKAIESYQMNYEEFTEWTKQNLALDALYNEVTKDIKMTDEELKAHFEENIDQYQQVRARHILIGFDTPTNTTAGRTEEEAKKEAEALIAKLKDGADFATLAKEKTEDPGSKETGGEYTFGRGSMVQAFEDAAFSLKPGEMTQEPVKTEYGYHIIKLEEIIEPKFENFKDELQATLPIQRKQEAFATYTSDIKAKADIKITEKNTEKNTEKK